MVPVVLLGVKGLVPHPQPRLLSVGTARCTSSSEKKTTPPAREKAAFNACSSMGTK